MPTDLTPKNAYEDLLNEFGLALPTGFSPRFSCHSISVPLPDCSLKITLLPKHLRLLEHNNKPTNVPGLTYHEHCGFSFKSYTELLLDLENQLYILIKDESEWIASRPLKFKVQDALVSIGCASGAFCLLMEPPYYDEEIGQQDLYRSCTLKLVGVPQRNYQRLATTALYYLNAHYLADVRYSACIAHLSAKSVEIDEEREDKRLESVARSRIRRRSDFRAMEPLHFYNFACIQRGESSFLNFYRVLEFFFLQCRAQKLRSLRYRKTITEEQILDELSPSRELDCLRRMLSDYTTEAMQHRLAEFAHRTHLIPSTKFNALVDGLYEFRNSIVHSKEEEIQRVFVPDQFVPSPIVDKWTYVVRTLATRVIAILNVL